MSSSKILQNLHRRLLGQYRLASLIRHVAEILPPDARVLDVGCGNGKLAAGVRTLRPDLHFEGVDLETVPGASIPIHHYDGRTIPFPDDSWDVCMASDVIHHCEDPAGTLKEMCRVTASAIVLKDHVADSPVDFQLLRFMDWIGNRGYGTPLPYNFLSTEEWDGMFRDLGLTPTSHRDRLKLYPPLFLGVLDRKMHFLACLSLPGKELPGPNP